MAMPKGDPLCLMAGYLVVYQQLEAVAWSQPNLEQASDCFPGLTNFVTLDLFEGL